MKGSSLFVVAAFAVATSAPTAHAFDLTGTWTGKTNCTTFTNEGVVEKSLVTVRIDQSGADLDIEFDGGLLDGSYDGVSRTGSEDPDQGQMGLMPCTPDSSIATTGAFSVKFSTPNTAKLKGRVNQVRHGVVNSVTVCKVSLSLESTSPPIVPPCP